MKTVKKFFHYYDNTVHLLIIGVICGILFGLSSSMGIPFFLQKVFSRFFEYEENATQVAQAEPSEFEKLLPFEIPAIEFTEIQAALALPLLFIFTGILSYAGQYLLNYCSQNALCRIRDDLFKKLQRLPMEYFDKTETGDLQARQLADVAQIQTVIMELANHAVRLPTMVLGGFTMLILKASPYFDTLDLLFVFMIIPFVILPVKYIMKNLKKRGKQAQEAIAQVNQGMGENLGAVLEVRSFNLHNSEIKKFHNSLTNFKTAQMKMVKYEKFSQPYLELIGAIITSIIFYYAAEKQMKTSDFLAIGFALYFCIEPLKKFTKMANVISKNMAAFDRVYEVLSAPESVVDTQNPIKVDKIEGNIEFEDIHFAYDENPLFQGINVRIKSGTSVALVGPSGSGKSTFAKLLPRFYNTDSGEIRFDGHNTKEISIEQLRDNIAIVPQNPSLFNDTVESNIRLGRQDATHEEIVQAAIDANAKEFIDNFEQGFNTMVGEDAKSLSGGQRQRLAIARAFLKDAPILILDEATSALDSESEEKVQEALNRLMKGKTVFVIAHRFSTIKSCDRILVIEKGKIVGDGPHKELLESCPLYKSLYTKQQHL